MILQTDSRLNIEINNYGCYFMSYLFLANKHTGLELDTKKIMEIYSDAVKNGAMKDTCFILDHVKIFALLGLKVATRKGSPSSRCADGELEILRFKNPNNGVTHYVAGDGRGNVAYDPYGTSKTVREGFLENKRIYTII